VYLRAEEKGLDTQLKTTLLKRTERESQKIAALIHEKISLEKRLLQIVQSHLSRLEGRMCSIGVPPDPINPYNAIFDAIPEASSAASTLVSQVHAVNDSSIARSLARPKKRAALDATEVIDPDEPVYCTCRQVSFGDMIACDEASCAVEWFHYACVGLTAPPKGRWFCTQCRERVDRIAKAIDEKSSDEDSS
jgi:hypothetical protein